MNQRLAHISILVDDYDRAIDYYVNTLNFQLIEDTVLSESKRWVIVKPEGDGSCSILLAKASGEHQQKFIGNQSGGRVFLFLHTDDFDRDFDNLKKMGVKIVRDRSEEVYGIVAVFEDQYGNLWDLIEPKQS